MTGLPSMMASAMAAQVPTLTTTQPQSMGRPPLGTSRPVSTLISCFSPPWGYLVFITCTRTPSRPWAAFSMAAMASGLLSSMPMMPLLTPSARMAARRPSTTRVGFSSISRWSAFR